MYAPFLQINLNLGEEKGNFHLSRIPANLLVKRGKFRDHVSKNLTDPSCNKKFILNKTYNFLANWQSPRIQCLRLLRRVEI